MLRILLISIADLSTRSRLWWARILVVRALFCACLRALAACLACDWRVFGVRGCRGRMVPSRAGGLLTSERWHAAHISVLSATKHACAAGAAAGDGLRPRRPGPWRSFDTYKRPKRDETERRKDGGAAFLHAGSIAAAFLHVGSIAAALLRAARALSVQKRHANERDV